jgi:hypothetical protein
MLNVANNHVLVQQHNLKVTNLPFCTKLELTNLGRKFFGHALALGSDSSRFSSSILEKARINPELP